MPAAGRLHGPDALLERLAADGIRAVADVLARSECIRDLPDRSNHVLHAGGLTVHVKRAKGVRRAREAEAIERARAAGVPTAALALWGVDPRHGAVTGTLDLAPARPLDDLLREGALGPAQARAVVEELARAVAALHQADLDHRDLYLCHVWVGPSEARPPLALIDLERLRVHRRALGRGVVKDLAALAASLPEGSVHVRSRARFLLRYLRLRGLPRRGVYDGLVRRIRRKAERIRSHVPRTPVGASARPETPGP